MEVLPILRGMHPPVGEKESRVENRISIELHCIDRGARWIVQLIEPGEVLGGAISRKRSSHKLRDFRKALASAVDYVAHGFLSKIKKPAQILAGFLPPHFRDCAQLFARFRDFFCDPSTIRLRRSYRASVWRYYFRASVISLATLGGTTS